MSKYDVLLVDSGDHTKALLRERIAARGHVTHPCPAEPDELRRRIAGARFHAMVLDHHFDRPDELVLCEVAKAADPALPVVVISAPGAALRRLEDWNAGRRCVDQFVRKPLVGEVFLKALEAVAGERAASDRAGRYAGWMTDDARAWADAERGEPAIAEMAVLFTDIRRSSERVAEVSLPAWFEAINRSLSAQSECVTRSGGSIVKFTGDGLLATFRGRGRSYRALRAAIEIQALDRESEDRERLRVGLGLAEGLVMSGPIGPKGRQQYDVLGATVHLAARLCGVAAAGEIVTTPRLARGAGLGSTTPSGARSVALRGFERPIECITLPQFPRGRG